MANPCLLYVMLFVTQVANILCTMYEAYTIAPADFILNNMIDTLTDSGQMTHFMCSVNAGKNGQTAFRIRSNTSKCEIGNIAANATQVSNGIRVYVESGIVIGKAKPKLVTFPTIAKDINPPHYPGA